MCISHVNSKDVMQQSGTITKTICTLPNRARLVLFPLLNVIAAIEYKQVKEKSNVPGKVALVKRRVIRFEGTEYIEAKDRDGCMPSEIILSKDPIVNFQTFKNFYNGVE
jgi:hypothetical protein